MHDSNSNRKWDIIHVSNIFSGIDFKFTNGTLFKVRPNIYVLKTNNIHSSLFVSNSSGYYKLLSNIIDYY